MAQTKFTKTLKGRNQQVVVTTPIALSTDATLALFLANAPTGEIGVYDAVDARHTDAIGATESFYIVQKKSDGSIKKTTLLKWSDVTASRKTYVAPVKATGSIGWSGTAGSAYLAAAPSAGKMYELALIETTEGNQPYPTWNFEYQAKGADVEADVWQALAKQINDYNGLVYKNQAPIVSAKVKADATYSNYALTGTTPTLTFTNGSVVVTLGGTGGPTHDVAVGDFISIDAAATPTDAVGDIYKVVAATAGTGFTLNRPYTGATQTFTEAESEGTRIKKTATFVAQGLAFTGLNDNEHFRIVARQELQYATIVNLATFTRGNGTSEQITELELEGNTFDGNTAGNTQFGNEAYGDPDRFAKTNGTAETYDMFTFAARQDATLVSPPTQGKWAMNIILACAKSAGGQTAALNTLFGL